MAENNLIKKSDLVRSREIDFVYRFNDDLRKFLEVLGVTRKIPKVAGTVLKAYKAVGTLQDGSVAEGDTIPLSKYRTQAVSFAEINVRKWRKATSAEAIIERGYDQAVNMTTDHMLKDVQKVIKTEMFNYLAKGTGTGAGATVQATLANIWGKLNIAYEDTAFEPVYFMNPMDAADYLGGAAISLQQAFGMTYIENFLGMGTVIFNSLIPKGVVYGTAKENLVLYYVAVNGADLDKAFEFTSDETGLIGIHEEADYSNMTAADTVLAGLVLFAERLDGVIVATINSATGVVLDKTTAFIDVAGTVTLTASPIPAGTSVVWSSSDTDVATVAAGVVTGVAAGTATITATVGSATATCVVTVAGA